MCLPASFLHKNNPIDLVALEVLDGHQDGTKTELLVGPQSALVMDQKDLIGFDRPSMVDHWLVLPGGR